MITEDSPYLKWGDWVKMINTNYLPHWSAINKYQFVTFRLGDSLPQKILNYYKTEKEKFMMLHPQPWGPDTYTQYHHTFTNTINHYLDSGIGSCILKNTQAQGIVVDCLEYHNHTLYELLAYVIMPNHVHVLFQELNDSSVEAIVKNWKSITSRQLKKAYNIETTVWSRDYYDTLIRNEKHLINVMQYIYNNPRNIHEGEYRLWMKDTTKL